MTFTVMFKPSAVGARRASLRITSNDSDNRLFNVSLAGTGLRAEPKIVVEQPARSGLLDGKSKRSFGTVKIGKSGVAKTFVIRNAGTANLTQIAVSVGGRHAKDFSVGKPGRKFLPPGASTSFRVVFKPKAAGTRSGSIKIRSNDKDQNPFDIMISGWGAK